MKPETKLWIAAGLFVANIALDVAIIAAPAKKTKKKSKKK